MLEKEYKDFSLGLHRGARLEKTKLACQFELTFKCPLHCRYCYSDCFNKPQYFKEELKTKEVFAIMDKLLKSKVLWLTFTGGDPLARKDFSRIYTRAKKKGFIITVFTSGMYISPQIIKLFKKYKPFCVEVTLNSPDALKHDRLSGVKGSFRKIIASILSLKDAGVNIKVKTMLLKDNYRQFKELKSFVSRMGLGHNYSWLVFPRLDHDRSPCALRLEAGELKTLTGDLGWQASPCNGSVKNSNGPVSAKYRRVFGCNAGQDAFFIDPYGNMLLCTALRKPAFNILEDSIESGLVLFRNFLKSRFDDSSLCNKCRYFDICLRCPGRAYLETGNVKRHLDYYCRLSKKSRGRFIYG
jgi:radical SAM protein with 4Fe4S-binding SPASM domain